MEVGRNDPCPCGSCVKFKRCCGASVESAAALTRRLAALDEAFELATLFPRLRAEGEALAGCAAALAGRELSRDVLDRAVASVEPAERQRIVTTFARQYPREWEEITAAAGAADAEAELIAGAVRVALEAHVGPPRRVFETLESAAELADRPLEALGLALGSGRVWSIDDAMAAGEATLAAGRAQWNDAIDRVAGERWDDWHETRLLELAGMLARRLPLEGLPTASRLLAEACAEVAADADARWEVGAAMLENYLVYLLAAAPEPAHRLAA